MKASVYSVLLSFSLIPVIFSCKSISSPAGRNGLSSVENVGNPVGNTSTLLDVNDVSILVPLPAISSKGYLRLSDKAAEGTLLSEDLFKQAAAMAKINNLKYEDWAMTALRIDNCAKLLAQLPCEVQMRLVFQPLDRDRFEDEALHIPFNIDPAEANQFFKDFIALKESALPESTKGQLGVHPILAKEGMEGPFAKRMNATILKYAKASMFERIAAMGTLVRGKNATWTFAASLPMKGQSKIEPTPIPCQNGEKLNEFQSLTIDGIVPSMPQTFSSSIEPAVSNCGNLDVSPLILERRPNKPSLPEADMTTMVNNALAINDPSKVFFGNTTCVNCHLAGRRLMMAKGGFEFLTQDDGNPNRFKAPTDVSTTFSEERSGGGGNTWNIRAFGWSDGQNPAITLYTFNDTLRVAHELNEMIRSGKLN